jgi:hypothetical protein
MKKTFIILLFCVSGILHGQDLTLPDKPYVIIIGLDTFITETKLIVRPDLSSPFVSGLNITGIKLVIDPNKNDSTQNNEVSYPDSDSLRIYTFLYRNENYRIKFPRRIDSVEVYDILSHQTHIEIDTSDYFEINRLVGNLAKSDLKKILDTEIQVYMGSNKLKVDRISVTMVWPDGRLYSNNYEKVKIGDYKYVKKIIQKLPKGSHLVVDCIWFYDLSNERHVIDGAIGWKII